MANQQEHRVEPYPTPFTHKHGLDTKNLSGEHSQTMATWYLPDEVHALHAMVIFAFISHY